MRKITFIALLLSFITIQAQDKGDIEIGGNIGLNGSNIAVNGNETGQTDTRTSFNIAATGEYYFSDRWGIKTKLIYDQKGWGNSFAVNEITGERSTGDAILNYISIPAMANWHFGKKRNWYLNFGLYAAFLTKAEIASIDTKEAYNTTDFGLALGIGVKFPISEKAKIFLEYDGQSGFSNIIKTTFDNSSARNGRSSLNLGVLFTL